MNAKSGSTSSLVRELRRRFANISSDAFSGRRIYFENAGGSLKLKSIFPVVERFTALPDNVGRDNPSSKAVETAIADGRRAVASFLGAKSGHIVAEQSTTSMLFRLLRTVARTVKGANMVTSNLDHASVYDATRMLSRQYGHEFRVAALDPRTGMVPISSVTKRIDAHTVVLTIIHSSNILGTKNHVAEIVRAARAIKRDLYVIIDGAQHASHGLVDVEALGADAYVFVPYKTFAKAGISFAHVSERLAALPHDNLLGKPKTAWDLGTREAAGYACMTQVVEYLQWLATADGQKVRDERDGVIKGMAVIERLELELINAFLHGSGKEPGMLGLDGITVYGQTDRLAEREAIFAFNVRGQKTVELMRHFQRNGITLNNRVSDAYSGHTLAGLGIEECMRVSLCHYNTVEEVRQFLKVLVGFARRKL